MEMKDHWSNQSTDPEISSSPAAAATTKGEPDIVQELCQDAIKRRIKRIKAAEAKAEGGGGGHLKSPKTAAGSREKQVFRLLSGLKPKRHFSSTELNPSESFQTDCCAAKHPLDQNGFYRSDDDIHIFPEASAICLDEGLICATRARTDSCSMPTPRQATGC